MADFPGNLIAATLASPSTTNPDFGQLEEPDYLTGWLLTWAISGSKTNNQPIAENEEARVGSKIDQFAFLDFYNRIHVTPLSLALGNIVSTQEREISVWNAYFVPHTLEEITITDGDGLTLSQPQPTPVVYGPLQELIYTLSVSTEGPPTVDAEVLFDFDSIDIPVPVTGVRIVAWIWEPNWKQPVLTRLAWNTDIITSDDASEQRRQLREYPRVSWEFLYDIQDDQRRLFENVIYGWGGRVWSLPVPEDVQQLSVEVVDGADVIPAQTDGYDFHVDGLGILIGNGAYESIEIETIAADHITIKRPLSRTWPAGTRLYPARSARLQDPRGVQRFTRNYVRGVARFLSEEEIAGEELTEVQYRGYPVLTVNPNWRDAPEIEYQRKMAMQAFGTGKDDVQDEADLALPMHTFVWTCLNREASLTLRRWLYARRGRQKAVWVPTFADDLKLRSVVSSSSTVMLLEACGLVHFAQGDVHRRDVRIRLRNGTVFYRRVTDFVSVDDESERVSMNEVLGQVVQPEDVDSISWMHLLRLDQDSIEIAWQTAGVCEVVLTMKGPRNDV